MSVATESERHLTKLDISEFSAHDAAECETAQTLTFPKFRSLLTTEPSETELVMAARLHGELVGLSILTNLDTDEGTLQSIAVVPKHRRSGIAGQLLSASEARALAKGCRVLTTTYTSALASTAVLNQLLGSGGWELPTPRILFCRGSVQHVHETAPWMKRIKVPKGFSIFEWKTLSSAERGEIESAVAAGEAPIELSPFYDENLIDESTSVGLRHGDRVIGWQINHSMPAEPGVMRYSRTYVYPEYQRMGRALVLIKEAIERNAAPEVLARYPRFVSDVAYERQDMVRFYERHLIPVSEKNYSSYGSKKLLMGS